MWRRDAALSSAGRLVVRVTYRRLVDDPTGVAQEIQRIITVRRSQLARAS